MTRHDDRIRLRHMLDHGREAVAMVRGRSRADLDLDRQLNPSIVRLLEIVGEIVISNEWPLSARCALLPTPLTAA